MKQDSREAYRRHHPRGAFRVVTRALKQRATEREVWLPNGECRTLPVYSIEATAQALGRTYDSMMRWLRHGQIPRPVLVCTVYANRKYYAEEEVRLIANQLAEHSREYDYFQKAHTQTIAAVRAALQAYREGNFYVSD